MNPNMTRWDNKTDPQPLLWNARQVARALGVTTRHLQTLHRRDGLPFIRIGRLLRYVPEDVKAWIEARKGKTV